MAIVDNLRPWKRLQLEFMELERGQLESRLEAARAGAGEILADLEARLEVETARLDERRDEIVQLEDDLKKFRGKLRAAELRIERLRHERLLGTTDPDLLAELQETRIEIESLGEMIADRESKLAAVRSDLDQVLLEHAQARAPIDALEHRLESLPRSLPLGGLWPLGIGVQQVRTEATVDRCVTCHLAAPRDDVGADDWPAHFRPHSDHELFLGVESPHPYSQFGCTVCHGGDGRATDFSRAGHVPKTTEQASSWESNWGWRPPSRAAMLPLDLTAASCASCHGHEASRPGSATTSQVETLARGQRLIASLGCTGCHASDRSDFTDMPRVGPSLVGIAGKTSPAWVQRWLEEPRAFRGTTGMPHVFGTGEAAHAEQASEIRAIVDYLWHVSRPPKYESSPDGEAEAGKMLFETVGCSGCHRLDLETDPKESLGGSHGPHLAGTGSKVDAGWLFSWLRDPRAYRRDTPMPSLRLDEREAADLVAYLMSRRDPAWERLTLTEVDSETRDSLILSALAESHSLEESQERFDRMSDRDKNVYLGKQAIGRYGCHGCHEIAGFEQRAAIGPSLGEVSQHLRDGVSSTIGETWPESVHQPAFALSDEERHAVTVALIALADSSDTASPDLKATMALKEGRRIVEHYGCRGCHIIEERGEDTAPDLTFTGARLKAPWLYEYLADPGQEIRPWYKLRMPTFGLNEAENNALVHYFSALNDRPLFADEPVPANPRTEIAVGRVVFTMLHCGDCHLPESAESPSPQLAPSYSLASERLRPDWVTSLILNPEHWLPGTTMPANFRPDGGDEESSDFLIGSINTPIFAAERGRLLRLLGSEERIHEVLSDPERVVTALRHYLWTLGK